MHRQARLSEASLPAYLERVGLVSPGEAVCVEPLGDGNINWVRRFRTRAGTRVVKQARPELERFPQYRTSTERIAFEARFYETVASLDLEGVCPRVIHFDPADCVLILPDLCPAERLDAALARGADVRAAAAALGRFLGRVHAATRGSELAARFANDGMRRLHGEHIFLLPFRPNEFPLPPRLRQRARVIQADAGLVARIDAAYARYLEPRGGLVHGDVQAANVLLTPAGPKLLDAEIAHVGDPAFDLGQLVAHLCLPGVARGDPRPGRDAARSAWEAYGQAWAGAPPPAFSDAAPYAGIEMLRRALGAARLPAVEGEEAALAVIAAGLRLVADPPASPDGI
jgi:5-methylthioribose kinase